MPRIPGTFNVGRNGNRFSRLQTNTTLQRVCVCISLMWVRFLQAKRHLPIGEGLKTSGKPTSVYGKKWWPLLKGNNGPHEFGNVS